MERKYLPIIKLIQGLGFQILYIDNTYFVVEEFIPADDQIDLHTIVGVDVTELINNHLAVVKEDVSLQKKVNDMISEIIKIGTETQKFHRDYSWRWFLNTGQKKTIK